MTKSGAERAVTISALIVFGVYFYRHLTEGTSTTNTGVAGLIGIGTPANIGRFLTAWGVVFFVLSVVAEAAPGLGGSFAILVATGDILSNTQQIAKDVNKKLAPTATAAPHASPTAKDKQLG